MSVFTDRLYRQWRQAHGGSGYGFEDCLVLVVRLGRSPSSRKVKAQRANAGPSVHHSTEKELNYGISKAQHTCFAPGRRRAAGAQHADLVRQLWPQVAALYLHCGYFRA